VDDVSGKIMETADVTDVGRSESKMERLVQGYWIEARS